MKVVIVVAEKVQPNGFFGDSTHTIDDKGRLFIPAKYRKGLGDTFMVCKSFNNDKCLFAYSIDEYNEVALQFGKGKSINSDVYRLQRRFYTGSAQMKTDKQGRTLIPKSFRDAIGLEKDVVIAGSGERIEIWPKAEYYKEITDDVQYSVSRRKFEEMNSING